ncbi:hypothetical protein SPRG_08212 [Saprolegnia parasitica CBS 223.65]|uniref:F-box domain-containing protein n=1 Tax=Saprolegnia parasitica (strain CBS 223.65) TaxID=695850 RepID=A0A067C6K1_SAPPC|nr:hypothetical protein SPRG_08212 [Saprolegnia parasitica CBS 223.65]KDO26409.1 hypothetical protein SPRG_08212 [Saprolegnia parasitica CBS 223.65]|eukprot:XP_012202846.1 hypothetical protein SPRG_08212 [Saprolegnia parasitica CBS 223.65]
MDIAAEPVVASLQRFEDAAVAPPPGSEPVTLDASSSYRENTLGYVLPFLSVPELLVVTQLNKEIERFCEVEWKERVVALYGHVRYMAASYRRIFALRTFFSRKPATNVSARVYLMNAAGDTTFFRIDHGRSLMCSRERASVYNRCERMFDLSLRINRSIQEISALIGLVSLDEARDLLNEHMNLMASVAALRGSLLFESELFQVFPAPVLLDANVLLRGNHALDDPAFQGVPLMMQLWVSLDSVVYRPLSVPIMLDCNELATGHKTVRFHELAGMTIDIDDNSIRHNLQPNHLCMNVLASNTYLLYLFNPTSFRPLDWSYEAGLRIGGHTHLLPHQKEGVFLNAASSALRVFLSYGKLVENRGNASAPLGIACSEGDVAFTFSIIACNRLTHAKRLVVSQAMRLSLPPAHRSAKTERHAHLANDAVICYSFDAANVLQYVEFAIGFEALLDTLGIASFLLPQA